MSFIYLKWGWRIIGLLVAVVLVFLNVSPCNAAVEIAWAQTSRTDFESGTLVHLDASSSPGNVKLGIAGIDNIYAFRGNSTKTNWKYALASNTWTELANMPDRVRWGGAVTYDGSNCLYGFHGNNSDDFWRYSISANTWSTIARAPGTVKEGGALAFNNGYIYALRGNNARDFWRYSPDTDSWTHRAAAGENVSEGGALAGDGGNYIYAFQGGDTNAFRRYDISSDAWTIMSNAPAAVGAGGALSYDDERYIYALRGENTTDFWRYDVISNVWSIKASAPDLVDWGGALIFDGGNYVYALAGSYSQYFWRYNISSNIWEWCTSTPSSVQSGGALVRGQPMYYSSGNLTSAVYDTGYNAEFGTISWTALTPAGTVVKFQVAANSDNATWNFKGPDGTSGTYYTSGGSAIWSGHDGSRYLKYKAFLSSANAGITPVLNDITLTYRKQILLPAVAANEASAVDETIATLHGTVTNDGGESCQYRFQYGKSTGNYTYDSGWTGSVITGEPFSTDITGLSRGTKYYFRAQVKNSAGIAGSPELSLLTKPAPPVAGSFIAKVISSTQINLSWVKGEGAKRTMVRRKTGSFPVDINDGVQVYFDTGTSVSDTGLAPGTTYYYSIWSEVTGSQQWSNSSQVVSSTTLVGGPVAVGGVVYPVNKALVMAPWMGVVMLFLLGGSFTVRRLIKTRN